MTDIEIVNFINGNEKLRTQILHFVGLDCKLTHWHKVPNHYIAFRNFYECQPNDDFATLVNEGILAEWINSDFKFRWYKLTKKGIRICGMLVPIAIDIDEKLMPEYWYNVTLSQSTKEPTTDLNTNVSDNERKSYGNSKRSNARSYAERNARHYKRALGKTLQKRT